MTDNVVNPFGTETAQRRAAQHYGRSVFDSTDALLGELLREVLEMRQQVAALQDVMADITDAMRTTRIRLDHLSGVQRDAPRNDVGSHHHGRVFPGTALRHGTPR